MNKEIQATENLSPGKLKLLELKKKLEAKKSIQVQPEEKKIFIKPKPVPKVVIRKVSYQEVIERKMKSLPIVADDPVKLKILIPKDEYVKSHINRLYPIPLSLREKVIVLRNQEGVERGYIKVLHGEPGHKMTSVMHLDHFTKEDGGTLYWKHRKEYLRMYAYLSGKLKVKLDPDDPRLHSCYTIQRLIPSDYKIKKKRVSAE